MEKMEIEGIKEYTYSRKIMSFTQGMVKELQEREKEAWKGYWALGKIFKGKMKVSSKIKILEACILPILTYRVQTWALTKKNKLIACK